MTFYKRLATDAVVRHHHMCCRKMWLLHEAARLAHSVQRCRPLIVCRGEVVERGSWLLGKMVALCGYDANSTATNGEPVVRSGLHYRLSDKYTELADGLNAPTGMVVAAQLKSMFMGGFVTLLAMGMYWLLCPRPIKNFRDRRDYVDYVVRGLDPDELNIALETLSDIPPDAVVQLSDLRVKIADLTNAKEEGIATPVLISDYYTFVDRRGMRAPMFCFSMLSIGAMLFLLPAAISVITALPSAMEIFDDRGQSFGLP